MKYKSWRVRDLPEVLQSGTVTDESVVHLFANLLGQRSRLFGPQVWV
jgi:hypothetical protein